MKFSLRQFAKALSLPLALGLSGCAGSTGNIAFTESAGAAQPFPANYRADLLAFMRTYLNDPVGVRGAVVAEPVQRTVGGNLRYVACLRYSARDFNDRYTPLQERGVAFVDGRPDRVVENSAELCAGASYQPFTELERLSR